MSVELSYRQTSDLIAAAWDHSINKILQVCGEAGIKDIHLLNLPDLLVTRPNKETGDA